MKFLSVTQGGISLGPALSVTVFRTRTTIINVYNNQPVSIRLIIWNNLTSDTYTCIRCFVLLNSAERFLLGVCDKCVPKTAKCW